ncbi:hypothetical protein BaRGS_00036662 [Batillaria attramentaria]|uniref:Uncharacterized protein n=1 Tax=Batillaria attramentaria TaxID=370345 RepID=A0ABD0JBB2_9CAEN
MDSRSHGQILFQHLFQQLFELIHLSTKPRKPHPTGHVRVPSNVASCTCASSVCAGSGACRCEWQKFERHPASPTGSKPIPALESRRKYPLQRASENALLVPSHLSLS